MKIFNNKFIFLLSVFLLIIISCFVFIIFGNLLFNSIILIPLFSIIIFSILIYFYFAFWKNTPLVEQKAIKNNNSIKLAVLSDSNGIVNEYHMDKKTSAMISFGYRLYFNFTNTDITDEDYACINKAGNHWYIERISEKRNVGIKLAGEQYIYKLKINFVYKIKKDDIIYIDGERLLVI